MAETLVRFEPCPWYADVDDSFGACVHCGWLEKDHSVQVDAPFVIRAAPAQRLAS